MSIVKSKSRLKGFTLVELIVSVGLFAIVMTLASGAYLLMISINQRTQGIATGINNLSFALESMTRTIRTGTNYSCAAQAGVDCNGGGGVFTLTSNNTGVVYSLGGTAPNNYIQKTVNSGTPTALTDVSSVKISGLNFYVFGTPTTASADYAQPYVTIVVTGTVTSGKTTQSFTIETGAAMRGTDL